MNRYHSYLHSAKIILQQFIGNEPFSSFLKKYFAANKKFGSKDRKQVSNLCYCFFRLGKIIMNTSPEEKMLTAFFLCSTAPGDFLEALKPEWNDKCHLTVKEKLSLINYPLSIPAIFPLKEELSEGMDHERFCESFLIQPDLFLRLRKGKEKSVKEKLKKAGIVFNEISEQCLSLPNASKTDAVIEIDKEAVIQDYSSQKTGEFIKSAILNHKTKISLWDCCAGSGGKSIMAYDINPEIELTVSDTRESILANLGKRFERAGIKKYQSFSADLSGEKSKIVNLKSDIILADVPCTGSGTWSRTPEQLYFFNEKKIAEYAALQKKIVSNVIPYLKSGGAFIYITCSVFRKENEEVVDFIQKEFSLKVKQMVLLKGYDNLPAGKAGKADSMFIAVFNS